MTHSEWLQTLAEIAVGFAGFSALIAGIGNRAHPLSAQSITRCLAVIETSLGVLFAAVFPVILHGFGVSESAAFRSGGALMLATGGPLSIRGIRRFRAASAGDRRASTGPLGLLGLGAVLVSIVTAVLTVVGEPPARIPSYFLASLVGTLGIAATNFVGFIVSHAQHRE